IFVGGKPSGKQEHSHEHDAGEHSHGGAGADHEHGERPPDVFLMGADALPSGFWERLCQLTSRGTGSKTGRVHDEAIYDEIFPATPNHYDRSDGDLMVLFFSKERLRQMPERYRDLLPRPWAEIESSVKRGETVELAGHARGLEIVVLGAPTADDLAQLVT